MSRNPILEEIYAVREKLLADVGGDLHEYVKQAQARAQASGRKVVTPKFGNQDNASDNVEQSVEAAT